MSRQMLEHYRPRSTFKNFNEFWEAVPDLVAQEISPTDWRASIHNIDHTIVFITRSSEGVVFILHDINPPFNETDRATLP